MRWTAHSSLGAATIAFYCPALIVSLALLCLRGLPRIAWFFLTLMSAVRISSGVLIILHESGQDYGSDLGTSTLTILEVGVFILIFASMEWLYLFNNFDAASSRTWLRLSLVGVQVATSIALVIMIIGSILRGSLDNTPDGKATSVHAAATLQKTSALLSAAILAGYIGILITLWTDLVGRKVRSRTLYLILCMLSLLAVLLILCMVYTCLSIFNGGTHSIWNPLDGSLDVLVRMNLLPEYAMVVVMLATGFWILRKQGPGEMESPKLLGPTTRHFGGPELRC